MDENVPIVNGLCCSATMIGPPVPIESVVANGET